MSSTPVDFCKEIGGGINPPRTIPDEARGVTVLLLQADEPKFRFPSFSSRAPTRSSADSGLDPRILSNHTIRPKMGRPTNRPYFWVIFH